MIKGDHVYGDAGPEIRIVGPANTTAKMDEQFAHRPVRGTVGWLRYSTYINVPKDAMGMAIGVKLNRDGMIWIDDLTLDVVK